MGLRINPLGGTAQVAKTSSKANRGPPAVRRKRGNPPPLRIWSEWILGRKRQPPLPKVMKISASYHQPQIQRSSLAWRSQRPLQGAEIHLFALRSCFMGASFAKNQKSSHGGRILTVNKNEQLQREEDRYQHVVDNASRIDLQVSAF